MTWATSAGKTERHTRYEKIDMVVVFVFRLRAQPIQYIGVDIIRYFLLSANFQFI